MKIAIIGAGAIGAWYAGNLLKAGHDIAVVARGETLEAVRRRGLLVNSETPIPVPVFGHISQVERPDVVILAMKSTGQPMEDILAGLDPNSLVATTQNSVEAPLRVAQVVGKERTLPGVVRGYFHHVGPGAVEFHGGPCSYDFGTWDGAENLLVDELATVLQSAGIDATVRDDIFVDVWEKAMFVTTTGALGAATGHALGALRSEPWRGTLEAMMHEVAEAGRGVGVPLSGNVVQRTLAFGDAMPAESTTSMQRDIAAGIPGELDAQIGAITREGRRGGVATPLCDLVFHLLEEKFR
ncbi:2-dehydropantoate 2-reductase [Corynebacterium breve]|uniref:2-dehydropantoate 2-reductase n=1 Tax=Corynebacterium breve TaxID=3049799 RepID=A0ABY8VFX2_9CORY|nr:2-dehydropantoate 2-reductase [Corynebacterium breve]WIM68544.1 2-dehydropantoate 2-reductase [Corynebacterium breve]